MTQHNTTVDMISNSQADPRTYIEEHFPAIRNAAIALDNAGFSYRQMAKLLQISTAGVWMHLTTNRDLRNTDRLELTSDELYMFEHFLGCKAYHRE